MKRYVATFTFSNFGGLQTVGEEQLSEQNLDILSRFGKVFDLTYTRFNDLKKAEAQAREAQIEASLERVRSRSMAMHKSDELLEAGEILFSEMQKLGIKYLSLSDTVGVADARTITYLYTELIQRFPKLEFGAHFHTNPATWRDKVAPAYASGCRRFDGAIKGFGGCPMAKDDLVGNMPTERLVEFFDELKIDTGLNKTAFGKAMAMAGEVFPV